MKTEAEVQKFLGQLHRVKEANRKAGNSDVQKDMLVTMDALLWVLEDPQCVLARKEEQIAKAAASLPD